MEGKENLLRVLRDRVRSRVRQKVLVKGQKWRHKETGEELLIDHWINFPGNFVCLKKEGASRFHLAIQPEDLLREYEWVSEPPHGDTLLDIRKKIVANYLANQSRRHRFPYDYPRPAPLRTRRDYTPVGRKTFLIEPLPDSVLEAALEQGRSSEENQSLEQENKEDSGR
ncbi:MAG: hypothetical protein GF334_00740 [Candidatus Altiarchaeales archaeon]|nr:hypothetical protein [Candidatus Altiarchaeales archaeon]